MQFHDTTIPGVRLVEADVFPDERGLFVRAWVADEFATAGLETGVTQASLATNTRRGTVRGLHYQVAPFEEVKVIRAVKGVVWDVALDLRRGSPTWGRWFGVELGQDNHRMLYIPPGVAHGYQPLTDDAVVFYFVSAPYSPNHQRGVRWNDPQFAIAWPLGTPTCLSERDAAFSDVAAAPPEPPR
ncbi:MAG TPA: dTDP-4-dehydrorhamnose 3,5-epimerase [Vicinamibacterales bacterium]|nr:dTDP-4-dehydrorhamnose 3,5-epimerase [Vicinamibacterales bacterium]